MPWALVVAAVVAPEVALEVAFEATEGELEPQAATSPPMSRSPKIERDRHAFRAKAAGVRIMARIVGKRITKSTDRR